MTMAVGELQETRDLRLESPLGADVLLLNRFSASERISGLFNFDLDLIVESQKAGAVSAAAIVGKPVTVSYTFADGDTRYFHGIVSRFSEDERDRHYHHYHAEVVPWLWLLTLKSGCRIFQD